MHILISNDDGFDAPGLAALYRAVARLGSVTVVAPSECHSAKGHAVVTNRTITTQQTQINGMDNVHICSATPADCVRIGLKSICSQKPDLVVTGINPGANLGVDVYYSGTVAAAREAAIFGIPAVAVSQYMKFNIDLNWEHTMRLADISIQRVLRESLAAGEFWNINLPALENDQVPRGIAFVPQSTEEQPVDFQAHSQSAESIDAKTPVAQTSWEFAGDYSKRPAQQPADVRYVFDGYATATRLQLDTTAGSKDPVVEPFA